VWGTASWVYFSVLWPVQWLVVGAWAERSPDLGRVAPLVSIMGGVAMAAAVPVTGRTCGLLSVFLGLGMRRAKPISSSSASCYSSSAWWLGVAHKAAAVAMWAVALTQPAMVDATHALLRAGMIGTSELHGIAEWVPRLMANPGSLGPMWAITNYHMIGLTYWITGSHLQDWAMGTDRLRASSTSLFGLQQLLFVAIIPSGYPAALSLPVLASQLRPATKARAE